MSDKVTLRPAKSQDGDYKWRCYCLRTTAPLSEMFELNIAASPVPPLTICADCVRDLHAETLREVAKLSGKSPSSEASEFKSPNEIRREALSVPWNLGTRLESLETGIGYRIDAEERLKARLRQLEQAEIVYREKFGSTLASLAKIRDSVAGHDRLTTEHQGNIDRLWLVVRGLQTEVADLAKRQQATHRLAILIDDERKLTDQTVAKHSVDIGRLEGKE